MFKLAPEISHISNLQNFLLLHQRSLAQNLLLQRALSIPFTPTTSYSQQSYQSVNNQQSPPEEKLSAKEEKLIVKEEEEPRKIALQSKKIKKEAVKLSPRREDICKKKKFWKPHEDAQVLELLAKLGQKWTQIGRIIGGRTGKQVRDRYLYTLNPDINRDKWTEEEDALLGALFQKYGNKWRQIAPHLPGRTENQIKNRFNSRRKEMNLNNSSPDGEVQQDSPTCDTISPIVKEEIKVEFVPNPIIQKLEY